MRNKKSIEEVDKSCLGEITIPLYKSYCFSNIFGTIKSSLGINTSLELPKDIFGEKNFKSKKVIFFLVDAFGWSFYERYRKESKVLIEMESEGVVSKLTSQFPSTTTAHVTTALTGLPLYEHGLYEWFYYEPVVDDIITAFLYKSARKKENGGLKERIEDPHSFIPKENYFEELGRSGVKSTVYQPSYINESIYTKATTKGATLKGYEKYEDLFENLYEDVVKNEEKEYYYIYLPEIDSIAHEKGNDSKEFDEIMKYFLSSMESFFSKGKEEFKNTLMLISADHGQIDTDLKKKNYLNELLPEIEEYIIKNSEGELMCPAGYCRDFFLHIKEEKLQECKELIGNKLGDILEVYTFEELSNIGMFGLVSERLRERCGNLVLLPKKNNNIWWYEKDNFDISLKGVHGGASEEEMHIPLLLYKFD